MSEKLIELLRAGKKDHWDESEWFIFMFSVLLSGALALRMFLDQTYAKTKDKIESTPPVIVPK